jgi:hypothetical protein
MWTRSGLYQGYWVRLQDRFGDRGVVGLAVVEAGEESWCIDSFQISSRVLERGVDTELILALGALAENRGVRRLEVSTSKTQQSRAFEALGFLPSLRPGVTCQLDLVEGWRKQLWRPSYVEGICILGDEEEKIAA